MYYVGSVKEGEHEGWMGGRHPRLPIAQVSATPCLRICQARLVTRRRGHRPRVVTYGRSRLCILYVIPARGDLVLSLAHELMEEHYHARTKSMQGQLLTLMKEGMCYLAGTLGTGRLTGCLGGVGTYIPT